MRKILFLALMASTFATSWSQAPDKISYQAVVRYDDNSLVIGAAVDVNISIRQGTESGAIVYKEQHRPTTNANGLASFKVGAGSGLLGDFNAINWANGPFFIETAMDPDGAGNYTVRGVSEIMAVPYALFAKTSNQFNGTIDASQVNDLRYYTDANIDGAEMAFVNWDKDGDDDFSGDYNDLKNRPNLYSQDEVDAIKEELIQGFDADYMRKAKVTSLNTSRDITIADVGNTIACMASATLRLTANFNEMPVGATINIEAHNGAELVIQALDGIMLNYINAATANFASSTGNVSFGLLRKTGDNSYIISGQ